jgi:hypothetical protein
MSSNLEIRPYRPGDEVAIVDAWNSIFPAQDGQAPRSLDSWRWAFAENPLRRCESVLAFVEGELVGQYASVPQRAINHGREATLGPRGRWFRASRTSPGRGQSRTDRASGP